MKIRGAVLERIGAPRPYAESRPLTISELDLADPGPDELLVRIESAGLCHSDLSVVDGNRVRPVPMLLGTRPRVWSRRRARISKPVSAW